MVAPLMHNQRLIGFLGISTAPGLDINEEERSLVASKPREILRTRWIALHARGNGKRRTNDSKSASNKHRSAKH